MSLDDKFKKLMQRAFNPITPEDINLENDIISELILKNAVQIVGVDSKGEPLYSFTPKIKEVLPALYEEHLNLVNKEVMNLWEKGFININFLEDNPSITLTEKAFDYQQIMLLSSDEQWSLNETKRLMRP